MSKAVTANHDDSAWQATFQELDEKSGKRLIAIGGGEIASILVVLAGLGIALLYLYNGSPGQPQYWWHLTPDILLRDALIIGSVGVTAALVVGVATALLCKYGQKYHAKCSPGMEKSAKEVHNWRTEVMDKSTYEADWNHYSGTRNRRMHDVVIPNWLKYRLISTELAQEMTDYMDLLDQEVRVQKDMNGMDLQITSFEKERGGGKYKLTEEAESRLLTNKERLQALKTRYASLQSQLDTKWTSMQTKFNNPLHLAIPIDAAGLNLKDVEEIPHGQQIGD